MNRKYTINQFINLCKYVRSKIENVSITTDYIVAFGNETEQQFNDSLKNLQKLKFSNMNVFIYSRRKGTTADKLYAKNIDSVVARNRYNQVVELKNKYQKQYCQSLVGKTLDVIVERSKLPLMHGYSSEFVKVFFKSDKNLHTKLIKVKALKVIKNNQEYCILAKKI